MKLTKSNCKQIVNWGGGRNSYKLRDNDMRKKGFTLIELLAVIVILAIIALITVPLILNVIETSKRGSFKDTAYGLIESAELYYSKEQLKGNNITSKTFTFPDASELGYKGETPKNGNLVINQRGQVALAISNDKYCITKEFDETEVTIMDDFEECVVEGADYVDGSGANAPDLLNNMVPIRYDGTNWIYTRTSQAWYNYNNKEWANAVVLNKGVTKKKGDAISEDEISLWYVWVPRYKYQLFNAKNESKPEQIINIEFESGTETTGTVSCTTASNGVETCTNAENGNWYTHPAFTLGTQQLTGIWVGKFEVSTTDDTCNSSVTAANCNKELPVTIKPGISSWRYAQVVNFFNSIQKMSNAYSITNGDSHMMKNNEWGAVAYLKQSKYGLGTADIVINNTRNLTGGGISNAYKTEANIKQSTTGNIYGVYDMNGGTYEWVMGNMLSSDGTIYTDSVEFLTDLASKYYDIYSYDAKSPSTYERGHLGDATKETLKTLETTSVGWYDDTTRFPYNIYSWFVRGGSYSDLNNAGIFYFYPSHNVASNGTTTRAVLTHK